MTAHFKSRYLQLILTLCLCFGGRLPDGLSHGALAAENAYEQKHYDTFELGFNPKAKVELIRTLMSDSGRLVTIRPGTVFIKDDPAVLKSIAELLANPKLDNIQQWRIRLRRRDQQEQERFGYGLGGAFSKERQEIELQLEQRSTQTDTEREQSVVTLNGEWAQFSLSTHEDRLVHYRLRYFPTVERIFNEAEVLTVKPMSSGESVRIDIKSLYLATVNGRREKFETQQIKTQMVIPKGRWVALGGSRNHSDRRDRHLWGLRQNNDQSDRGLEIEIRIDPTPL